MTSQTLDTGTPDLLATLDAGVLTLTLNRPDARNAMSRAMNQALAQQLAAAELNPAVKCIVLTGAGKASVRAATSRAWPPRATARWARSPSTKRSTCSA